MCLLTHTVPAVNHGTRTRSNSIDYYYISLYNIQQGLAAHSQGTGRACGSEQWMLWLLALLIPPYSAWANLQEQGCSSSSVLIDLPQPEEHWDSPQLSQLLSAPPHTCRPTLASSEKLQGLHPSFFFFPSSAPLDTQFWHTFPCILCHSWRSWGRMEAASSAHERGYHSFPYWARQTPLLSLASWSKHRVRRLWQPLTLTGPFAARINFLNI